ncbi:hypothetical protein PSV08DRAFT_37625, partial [Bipolaris maydis]
HRPSTHLQPPLLLLSPYICPLSTALGHFTTTKQPSPPISTMSAITETRQSVYVSEGFSEPMSAQHNFANNFDLNDPERAMSEYQRIMHEHTKRQLTTATDSARRRSGGSNESVSSTSS